MKKKKITALFLVMAMVFTAVPAQGVMAEEMVLDSSEIDDAKAIEETEVETADELSEEFSENAGIPEENSSEDNTVSDREADSDEEMDFSAGDASEGKADIKFDEISLNKDIKMKSLNYYLFSDVHVEGVNFSVNGFSLNVNVPESGRIMLVGENIAQIRDVLGDKKFYLSCNKDTVERDMNIDLESFNTGYITVKPGNYTINIDIKDKKVINNEASLKVVYQTLDEYSGEKEDNDTYDTATPLKSGVEYYGDYSKRYDEDIYSFCMEKSGKAQIDFGYQNGNTRYKLLREDEEGNVYEIGSASASCYWRLPKGNYFVKLIYSGYKSSHNIKWNAEYESEEEYETEDNNLQSTANFKNVNQWYTGNINNCYNNVKDVDWFRFDIDKKSYVYAEMRTERGAEESILQMELWQDGKTLETDENTANPYLKTKTYLVDPGTYYICMKNVPQTWKDVTDIPWDYSIRLVQRDYIDLTGLSLPESIKLKPGQSQSLTLGFEPVNTDDKEVEWISDSEDIATVDQNGKVTAKKAGTANIIVCGKTDQEIQDVCTVTVEADKPVSISRKTVTLTQGKNFQLQLKNAGKGIIWKSSSSGTASVTQTGKITARASGKTTVTARYKGKNYSCTVTVLPAQQKITYIKPVKTKTAALKWKKNTGAAGYQIQYSTDPKMKKNVKTLNISNRNTYTRTITGLQRKKRYYFRVRAYGQYKTRKLYGTFSTVKNCIIK